MLHFYMESNSHVLLVDDAEIKLDDHDKQLGLKFEYCQLPDVIHLGGGIYDAIVFPTRPPNGILRKAIEKIYWGGIIIILGIEQLIEEAGYQVLSGDASPLVLRRPPLPPIWSEDYYMTLKGGDEWNPDAKTMHQRYRDKFAAIDVEWEDGVVIEYGCGRGEITRLIALAGTKRVYAVDQAPAALSLTAKFCNDLDNVSLICEDALSWESPQKADIIVALDFVEHVAEDDLPRLFRQMRENLNSGGLVHIVTPLGPDAVRDHRWHPTPQTLREKMELAGFKYKRHVKPEGSRKFLAEFTK